MVPLEGARDRRQYGGKAAQLAWLRGVGGVSVPDGFVIAAAAFERAVVQSLAPAQRPDRVVYGDAPGRRPERLSAIRRRVESEGPPAEVAEAIVAAWRALGACPVAVRSSGLHEDGEDASAAGLQESVLGVTDAAGLLAAVARCWGSMYGERAVAYLARRPQQAELGMAVVVQRLVAARVAGVLFTADPLSGDRGLAVIEAAPGLGLSVVDGDAEPDVLHVARDDGRVRAFRVGTRRQRWVFRDAALVAEPLSGRAEACVGPAEVEALLGLARRVEAAAAAPRDIEWAFEGDRLWALQSRPIVGLRATRADDDLDDPARWVWSNVNVGEALPGVATPLTWSIAEDFSGGGFRSAFRAIGCEVPERLVLVGNFHGRIFLNLTSFMRVARQVPLFNPKMLLEFGGGGGLDLIETQVKPGRWAPFLRRAPWAGARFAFDAARLDARLARFERDFGVWRATMAEGGLADAPRPALGRRWRALRDFLDHTGELMLSCASGYLASVVAMRSLLRAAVAPEAERFERELLAGFADLESAAPGVALVHLGEIARREEAARAVLTSAEPAALRVEHLPEGPTRRAFCNFLEAYGFRCAREAELSTPRWREAPGPLFAALRAHLSRPFDPQSLARMERQSVLRARAEAELEGRLPGVLRATARHLLARTQRFARLRERLRARVTECLGFLRQVALAASAQMPPRWGPDGAFYLSSRELSQWLDGALGDVEDLVAARRAEVIRDLGRPDPPSLFVGSPPRQAPAPVDARDRWLGVAAAGGVVTGVVRVLRAPEEGAALQPGEVLVTPVADVGWTPLFLVATAVVTELGGALSHAALVAREYGVPVVANVPNIARSLKTGDRVRVDGDRGVVERLGPEP
ncbi:MAG: hypothetical protein JNK72_13355 [Myxococcales bacterium]|nr:hypothetical protein [Myxococcales bacterium]